MSSCEVFHRFTGHKGAVRSLSLCPDGDFFASGSEDGAVKIWDLGNFGDETDNALEAQKDALSKLFLKCLQGEAKVMQPRQNL